MKDMLNFFRYFFTGASGKLRLAVCAVLGSALVVRFPVLTNWLGEDIHSQIMSVAYEIKSWAWASVMLFVKQYNVTGGSKDAEVRPAQSQIETKKLDQ